MGRFNRLISWLLILTIVLSMAPLQVFASETEVREFQTPWTVNPVYEGILDEALFADVPSFYTLTPQSDGEYLSEADASVYLRQQMVARNETVTVNVVTDLIETDEEYSALLDRLLNGAVAHTGVPNEGDYLAWQYGGCSTSASGYDANGSSYYSVTFTFAYYTNAEQEAAVDTAVDTLLASLDLDGKSDFEKIAAIYDYICATVTYDNAGLEDDTDWLKYTAYGALIEKNCVCQGYSNLFYRLALEAGVDVRLVTGVTGDGERHSWNIVELGGTYYNLDATWDAGQSIYSWFLKNEDSFTDHYRDEVFTTEAFYTQYPMAAENYYLEVVGSGTCGDNLTWTLDGNGVLTISGTGDMYDYYEYSEWGYDITEVIIEDGVTSIGGAAFYGCKKLTGVVIADSVVSVGDLAFKDCWELKEITISASTTEIGVWAFGGCHALESIGLSPDNETYTLLDGVLFTKDMTTVILYPPAKAGETYTIPGSVTTVGPAAFSNCVNLVNITIPDSVTAIGPYGFYLCASLEELDLPNSVRSIGDFAFYSNESLTEVTIPASVTYLGDRVFSGGENVTAFTVEAGNQYYTAVDGVLFTKDMTTLIQYPASMVLDVYQVPGTVTMIANEAFHNCYILAEVILPDGVTTIGEWAFISCFRLGRINLPDTVTTIGKGAFDSCESLSEITIPDSVTSIGPGAFYGCARLRNITIPASVTFLGNSAFGECGKLIYAVFQGDMPEIDGAPFLEHEVTAYYPAGNTTWDDHTMWHYGSNVTWISYTDESELPAPGVMPDGTLYGTCGDDLSWTLTEDGVLTISGTGYMDDYEDVSAPWYGKYITSVVITEGLENISNRAFADCTDLTSVTIADGVSEISNFAFYNCSNLESIALPDSMTAIYDLAFYNSGLTSIHIPKNVDTMDENAFENCAALEAITVSPENENFTAVDGVLFSKDMTTLICYPAGKTDAEYTIPDSVTTIGEWAFDSCTALETVTIPDSVSVLGYGAFGECRNLSEITFQGSAPQIDEYAFGTVTATIYYPAEDATWTEAVMQDYGGYITWMPHEDTSHTHAYTAVVTDPTCTGKGYTTYTCACGDSYVGDEKPANGHTSAIDAAVPATCTSTGLTEGSHCSVCGTVLVAQTVTSKLTHEMGAWVVTENATCAAAGEERRDCANCDYFETRDTALADHTPVTDAAVPATCTSTGLTEGSHCSVCGTVLVAQTVTNVLDHKCGEDGTCIHCGTVLCQIIDTGRTLILEGVIYINQYVKIQGFEGVDVAANGGLLVWDHYVTEEEAVYGTHTDVNAGLIKSGSEYKQQTDGIAAKEYADTIYLRVYIQLPDGTYVYGPLKEYSVRHYCETIIGRSSNAKLVNTCIAMLHFGAAAQEYFGYNTGDLANKNIVAEYPVESWDASLLTGLEPVNTNIVASSLVSDNGRTLSLNGAIEINAYYGFAGTPVSAELLTWEGVSGTLTVDNVTYRSDMVLKNGEWVTQSSMIAAKEYGETVYLCAHFVDAEGNHHYSNVVAFSPEEYARRIITSGRNAKLVVLVQQMVIYGDYARIYFNK